MVTSVEFDSRKVVPGTLFVALGGETVDGHDFAPAAVSAGAVAVLGSRPMDVGVPQLLVDGGDAAVLDRLAALAAHDVRRLMDARTHRHRGDRFGGKDLHQGHDRRGARAAPGPWSRRRSRSTTRSATRTRSCGPTSDTRFLVLELSARGIGHIAALAATAPPRIGVVLNVGSAHIGEFGSAETIALAKGELVEALPTAAAGGIAILNADDPRVAAMAVPHRGVGGHHRRPCAGRPPGHGRRHWTPRPARPSRW